MLFVPAPARHLHSLNSTRVHVYMYIHAKVARCTLSLDPEGLFGETVLVMGSVWNKYCAVVVSFYQL